MRHWIWAFALVGCGNSKPIITPLPTAGTGTGTGVGAATGAATGAGTGAATGASTGTGAATGAATGTGTGTTAGSGTGTATGAGTGTGTGSTPTTCPSGLPPTTWYADADADGWGDSAQTQLACDPPYGYVAVDGDCDDSLATANPNGIEDCATPATDEDCDGLVGNADAVGALGSVLVYPDFDADGWGDGSAGPTAYCTPPPAWVSNGDDCDDTNSAIGPSGGQSSVTLSAVDSASADYFAGSTWGDDRLRAYWSAGTDIVGWSRFDLTGLTPGFTVTAATLSLHGENNFGSPFDNPTTVLVHSADDAWTRASANWTTVALGPVISTAPSTVFDPTAYNDFDIDPTAWDWASDIADGAVTIGIDNTNTTYSYVYFYGTDVPSQAPELYLEGSGCP